LDSNSEVIEGVSQLNDTELAWIAGFFDGDGSVGIRKYKRPHCRSPIYDLVVKITNSNIEVLKWIQNHFGGTINHDHKSNCYKLRFGGRVGMRFLEAIFPYLKVKRKQAKLGIALQSRHTFQGGPGKFLPKEELEEREQLYQELRKLNKRGWTR